MVLLEQEEDGGLRTLTRHLIAFRVVSKHYKQADKAHRLRLDEARDLATKLRGTGFRVRNTRRCGPLSSIESTHSVFGAQTQ